MLKGLPGLNVIEYTTLHGLQGLVESRDSANNNRIIVCNEIVSRFVTALKNMYINTEYICIGSKQPDAWNIQNNLRLAILLCTRA